MFRILFALSVLTLGATLALSSVAHADIPTRRLPGNPKDFSSAFLVSAVEDGKIESIKRSLLEKINFDFLAGYYDQTALEVAVGQGKLEIVRLLLAAGAPLTNATYPNRPSVLLRAAARGSLDVTRLLLEHKAEVEARNDAGETALMLATKTCNIELIKLLIDAGSAVDGLAKSGATALFYAIAADKLECVNELLQRGASHAIATKGIMGYWPGDYTPLGAAASLGYVEIMKALIKRGADVNQPGPEGTTPLFHALQRSQSDAVRALLAAKVDLSRRNSAGETPLLVVARQNDKALALELLAAGADPLVFVNVVERPLELLVAAMRKDAPELRRPLAKYLTKAGRPKTPLPAMPAGKAEFGELCMKSADCNSVKSFACVPDQTSRPPYSGTCLVPIKTQ